MEIINFRKDIKKAENIFIDYLKRGRVIIYPTDTIYGLGCLATNRKAIKRIFKIKKRKKGKPMIILISSVKMAEKYCYINKKQKEILKLIWGKSSYPPVSVILRFRGNLPKELTGGQDSLAMRLPKNDFLIKIIKKIGAPLVSTSANISGEKPITNVKDFITPLTSLVRGAKNIEPDLVIDGGKLKGKASIIIDLIDVENIKIVRK